jgi:pyruvate dehydrogenase E2 component (dihydrolipoamide acetyltransferase)
MTVTNLGNQGVKYFTPILNYPESVILGTGCMTDTPVVVNGGIFVHPILGLSLTFDHRVINGLPAAKFLAEITKNLADFRWV